MEGFIWSQKGFPGILSFGESTHLAVMGKDKDGDVQQQISIKFTTSSDAFLDHFRSSHQKRKKEKKKKKEKKRKKRKTLPEGHKGISPQFRAS